MFDPGTIFVASPDEDWVCDRLASQIINRIGKSIKLADQNILYLIPDWCWRSFIGDKNHFKTFICTVHHIVPEKFGTNERRDFLERHKLVDVYHFTSTHTLQFCRKQNLIGNTPVVVQPFWIDEKEWFVIDDKMALRKKYNLPLDKTIIFSAQRDTEGGGLNKIPAVFIPKLEKGPDIFCDLVIERKRRGENIFVLLAGWRRQYIIQRLRQAGFQDGLDFRFIDRPPQATINEFYNISEYFITSRQEGGPLAVLEAAATKCPIVSTDVGCVNQILSPESISKDMSAKSILTCTPNVEYAFSKVQELFIGNGSIEKFLAKLEPFIR